MYKPIRIFLLLVLLLPLSLFGQNDSRGDSFDVSHYHIDLKINDFVAKEIGGYTDVNFKSVRNGLKTIRLDLWQLQVDSVKQADKKVNFSYDNSRLLITLSKELNQNETGMVRVYYQGKPKMDPGGWGGFYWGNTNGGYAFNLGVTFQLEPHNFGRAWHPCVDNFTDRATYSFAIRTLPTHKAICNGELIDSNLIVNGLQIWQWKLDETIVPYLSSVAVAQYELIEEMIPSQNGSLPAIYAAWAQDTANARWGFRHMPSAVKGFEESYGPYLFSRIGYSLVPFNSGAMEHATNIALPRTFSDGNTADEGLWSHELSHHWWGDLVTCKTAEDMWLNEGWATFSENIFYEYTYGWDAYKLNVLSNHIFVLKYAHRVDNGYRALTPMPHEYTYGRHVYNKGADVAHTLRGYMGDSLFFGGIRSFLDKYKFQAITTEDFKNHLTSYSGINLTSFFDNWVYEKGFPHFSIIEQKVEKSSDEWKVSGAIRQRLLEAPTLYTNVPIMLRAVGKNGEQYDQKVMASGAKTTFQFNIPFEPLVVMADPEAMISDAITNQYFWLSQTDSFGVMNMASLKGIQMNDSTLVHIEHHWLAPSGANQVPQGITLSSDRYWSLHGTYGDYLDADFRFQYDGRTTNNAGLLDLNLLAPIKFNGTYTEDNIVLLYRPTPESDWQVDAYYSKIQGVNFDKFGEVSLKRLRQGDYALGLSEKPLGLEIPEEARPLKIFPNPAQGKIYFRLPKNHIVQTVEIMDMAGHRLKIIDTDHTGFDMWVDVSDLPRGHYIIHIQTEKTLYAGKFFLQ